MKWISILVFVIILGSCQSSKESEKEINDLKIENQQLLNQVNSLQVENQKLLAHVNAQESAKSLMSTSSMKVYTQLKAFSSMQVWKSISIQTGNKTVTLTDPDLLQAMGEKLVFSPERIDFPNGPQSDIDNFSLILTNDSGTYNLDIVGRDVVSFPDLAAGVYFRSPSNIADLGRALMPKPEYMTVDSWESRMLNSGMIQCKDENSKFLMISSFRARGVAIAFLSGTKKTIPRPKSIAEPYMHEILFYLYGNQIEMKVYPTQIQILDGNKEIWYQVDKELPQQIHGFLVAG